MSQSTSFLQENCAPLGSTLLLYHAGQVAQSSTDLSFLEQCSEFEPNRTCWTVSITAAPASEKADPIFGKFALYLTVAYSNNMYQKFRFWLSQIYYMSQKLDMYGPPKTKLLKIVDMISFKYLPSKYAVMQTVKTVSNLKL